MIRIDPGTRDISSEVLDEHGRLRILSASYWAGTTVQERALFGTRHGCYSLPTTELVDHLRGLVDARPAIEIGAGNGVLAEALGIPATDSRQQEKTPYRQIYEMQGQAIVPYGPNIIEVDANRAVRRFWPEVVIGCWITHRYSPRRHHAGGNEAGVDELDLLKCQRTYIHVGNERVHQYSRLWSRPHKIEYPPWLYSRAHNGSRNFIAIWEGGEPP